jgi:hypothetical protein
MSRKLQGAMLGLAMLVFSSPSYAVPVTPSIISNTFFTPEDTPLVVPAPGVATGATDSSAIFFYLLGPPSQGSFLGLTTITTGNFCPCTFEGTTDGSFSYQPPPGISGVVINFIVQGALSDPPQYNGGGSFDGSNAVTDHIVITGPISATPLPAALPLFATGLGTLGLLGWRRQRKRPRAMPDRRCSY